ncbi:hypothetical protein [Pseudochrobactrum sp. MP213Fo]|uniref:hypothetical protein n=1 Tax=Pseudochrobactrum sp. MP213Fo TaxID=3022250 RepID=UPI003BA1D36E
MYKYDCFILGDAIVDKPEQSCFTWILDSANFLASAQMIAALVTAGATIALWRVTRVLATETKVLAKMTAQPFIVCSLRSSPADSTALDLVIQNTGNAVAFDIKVNITPGLPIYNLDGTVSTKKATDLTISMLPPMIFFKRKGVMATDVKDTTFTAAIEWRSHPAGEVKETVKYEFNAQDGFAESWNVKGMHQLVTEVEKISTKIK